MYGLGNEMGGGFNVWTWIILILIVLQWFKVGGGIGGPGGESNLLCNGGLFIIALFLLVACSCFKSPAGIYPQAISPMRHC